MCHVIFEVRDGVPGLDLTDDGAGSDAHADESGHPGIYSTHESRAHAI